MQQGKMQAFCLVAGDQDALRKAGFVSPQSPEDLEAEHADAAEQRSSAGPGTSGSPESPDQGFPQ